MSTAVMSLVWPLQMPPAAKSVLVSLADNANDCGYCWPSLETICARTCYGRTAVIDAIKWLEAHGFLTANRANGRKTTYQLTVGNLTNQSASRTGPPAAPVRQTDPTSPPRGRVPVRQTDTNRHTTINEPSEEKQRASRAQQVERPDDVAEIVWSDFIALRRAKRAPLTQTALDGIRREADKAGVLLGEALSICCERGWQGFRADWYTQAPAGKPRQSAAVESFLALTGRSRNQQPAEVIDVSTSFLLR